MIVTRLFAGTPWDRPPTCERCGELEAECKCPPVVPELLEPVVSPDRSDARQSIVGSWNGKSVGGLRRGSLSGRRGRLNAGRQKTGGSEQDGKARRIDARKVPSVRDCERCMTNPFWPLPLARDAESAARLPRFQSGFVAGGSRQTPAA